MDQESSRVKKGRTRLLPGASPGQIEEFERDTGIRLPKQYKEWLLVSDGGEVHCPEGPQLLGVSNENPKLQIRQGDSVEAPANMAVIGRTSTGDAICCISGEEHIIQWSHETNEKIFSWKDMRAFWAHCDELYGEEP